MKKSLFILLVMLVAACGGGSDAVKVAQTAMHAFERQDAAALNRLTCQPETNPDPFRIKHSFENLKYEAKNGQGNAVDVVVSGKMRLEMEGQTQLSDFSFTMKMQKQNGNWCINRIESF